ncbi:glycoside hydrolase family 2 protein [Occallatibacter riparius]|uniref:Beta-glucuronidase n=1 Tax=Occallatibacter riparius TaxID=1002689 RepID=A0A9J7BRW6_9BACT|nr:glycoside hydrolase family 2 TIM barrel-domain containing protein [Occallatibacter riparius]UWZ85311.1 beta-glucuronidase [Occallatibacter riparius]
MHIPFLSHIFVRRAFLAVLAVAILAPSATALAQEPLRTLLVGVDRREVNSLNGDWHYLVDQPPFSSLYDSSGKVRNGGYGQNTHPNIDSGPHNAEYDFATAPTLKVPGDWNTQDPTLFRFEGVVWYQRDFNFQPQPNKRTFLHVGAANYRSYVWVNGQHICDHEGGFTPFDCEVTAAVKPGSNFVVVAVDSTRHVDDIPTVNYDWFDYGGLTRDVSLVTVPSAFIDDYDVHLRHGTTFNAADAAILSGYIHVEGATAGTPVTLRIREAGVDTHLQTDAAGRASFEVKAAKLDLWSPENPRLYKVELAAGDDRITDEIGFRDVRVEGTRILLNGKPIFLQGANAHAEAPIRTGRVCTDQDVKNLFGYLKDLHANFVRLAHYPHDERMERMADRQGILIWSEIPNWQRISFDKPEVFAKDEALLREMIRRDRNKASVILWSVSNETPDNPVRTEFLTRLANEARQLDPTRLITSALNSARPKDGAMVLDDKLADALDMVGINEYIGWYVGKPEDADNTRWVLPEKPIIFSEFGAEAKYGNHGGDHARWTEEQQANVLAHQFAMLRKIPQLRGVTPWVLMDFRSPSRNIPKLQDGFNRKGLLSEKGEKKLAFSVVQKAYEDHSIGKPE